MTWTGCAGAVEASEWPARPSDCARTGAGAGAAATGAVIVDDRRGINAPIERPNPVPLPTGSLAPVGNSVHVPDEEEEEDEDDEEDDLFFSGAAREPQRLARAPASAEPSVEPITPILDSPTLVGAGAGAGAGAPTGVAASRSSAWSSVGTGQLAQSREWRSPRRVARLISSMRICFIVDSSPDPLATAKPRATHRSALAGSCDEASRAADASEKSGAPGAFDIARARTEVARLEKRGGRADAEAPAEDRGSEVGLRVPAIFFAPAAVAAAPRDAFGRRARIPVRALCVACA